jgi:hypothetical protein
VLVSRSREHVAYVAVAKGRPEDWDTKMGWGHGEREAFTVQDGRVHGRYQAVYHPTFTPDACHLAYVAVKGDGGEALVLDGRESPGYDPPLGVLMADVNPRTGQVGYLGRRWYGSVLGIDGVEREYPYDVEGFVWSPDGRREAYLARMPDGRRTVVVDGAMDNPYDEVPFIMRSTFSPDGRVYAYAARQGDKWFYVVNGKAGPTYDYVELSPQWVAGGHDVAYLARRGHQGFLVVGGEELAGPCGTDLVVSPDGSRWAYVSGNGEGGRMVIDGVKGPYLHCLRPAIFSPDSRRVAYTAGGRHRSAGAAVVVDGDCRPVDGRLLTFSPDSKHLAYVRHTERRDALVIDGQTRDEHTGINPLWFSPDSRHVAYVAHAKTPSELAYFPRPRLVSEHAVIDVAHPDKVRVVVDGQPGREFRGVCLQADCFRAGGVVEYVAVRGNKVYQVEQSVPDQDWVSQ